MSTFHPLEINTLFFFIFMKEMKTKLSIWMTKDVDADDIQSTGGQRSDDDASKSGGKKK